MRRSTRLQEGPAPGGRTRRAAFTACLSVAALGATAAPALAVDPTVFTDNPGDGITLREAIQATGPGGTVRLQSGTYQVSLAAGDGSFEDGNASGDLDIDKSLTIVGAGMDQTIIRSANPGPVDGVLHVVKDTLTLADVTVTGGARPTSPPSAQQRGFGAGGGIRVGTSGATAGNLVADRVKVAGNRAFRGAGVFVSGAPTQSRATFTDSIITGNLGSEQGGGLAFEGVVTLNRSAVVRNRAQFGGGLVAFVNPRGELTATNTTIGGNTAIENGGGILTGGFVTLDFVTLANNSAKGGRNLMFAGGRVTVSNTIIAGSADNSCANNAPGDIVSGGYNIDQGATCIAPTEGNGDRINVPPTGDGGINLIEPLPAQGIYYYRLAPNSVAKDTGTEFCFEPVDQRGVPRPQGIRCDVGAIEQEPPTLADVGVESFVENPDPVIAGDDLTYEAVVRNIGNGTAEDVVFRTSVPNGTTFVSASNGCARPRPDALRCELGDLPPDGTGTVTLTVKTSRAGTLTNRGDVSARAGQDVNPGNNRLGTSAEVQPRIDPDPEVTVGLVKAVKRTAKRLPVRVGVNRDRSSARVALFTKRYGTLVLKTVRFPSAGEKTVKLKLSKSVRRKLAKLKKGTKLQVRVDVELPGGDELRKRMGLKLTKSGRIKR